MSRVKDWNEGKLTDTTKRDDLIKCQMESRRPTFAGNNAKNTKKKDP